MAKAVGVKFPHTLKIYDFLPGNHTVAVRDFVVVETTQGKEIGQVIYVDREIADKDLEAPLKEIDNVATEADITKQNEVEERAKELYPIFIEKIEKYGLSMNPVGVSLSLDETKAVFYFTAEGRVDFRELARELSRMIQKQAILRQIGPRDEAKLIGGYGRCGRPICCGTFLIGTEGVSMDTVEKQFGGPKSASKISGICGRLMCCLNYEEGEGKARVFKKPFVKHEGAKEKK
jgi:cell fate regulator YaaT (PSP1 superfamily)